MIYPLFFMSVVATLFLSLFLFKGMYRKKSHQNLYIPLSVVSLVIQILLILRILIYWDTHWRAQLGEQTILWTFVVTLIYWCVQLSCFAVYGATKIIKYILDEKWRQKYVSVNITYLIFITIALIVAPNLLFGMYYSLMTIFIDSMEPLDISQGIYYSLSIMFDNLTIPASLEEYKTELSKYGFFQLLSAVHVIITYLFEIIFLGLIVTRIFREIESPLSKAVKTPNNEN